jgi:hypothetical protein
LQRRCGRVGTPAVAVGSVEPPDKANGGARFSRTWRLPGQTLATFVITSPRAKVTVFLAWPACLWNRT